jgi:hypothetical protein
MRKINKILNKPLVQNQCISESDLQKVVNEFTRNEVIFNGTVRLGNANVINYPSYINEEAAIDAGLIPGDKFLLNNIETTVTKIKQTFTLTGGTTSYIGFLIDMTNITPAQFYTQYIETGVLTITTRNPSIIIFDSSLPSFLNTLTSFSIGFGYSIFSSLTKVVTIYGKPVNNIYKRNLTAGQNIIAWVDETTDSIDVLPFYGGANVIDYSITENSITTTNPSEFIKGKAYDIRVTNIVAEQGLPKVKKLGDTLLEFSFPDLSSAIAGGVVVGQLYYNTTDNMYKTRMS